VRPDSTTPMIPHVLLLLSPILAFLPSATAHGFLTRVVIDGTTYTGNAPTDATTQTIDSPIRQIGDIGPVKGASNPYLNCGLAAQLATMVVPANPGSVVEFYWGDNNNENVTCFLSLPPTPFANYGRVVGLQWPHNTGSIMTYMAACDTSTCDKFNGSTAKWFKIDQLGQKSDGSTWYLQDVSAYRYLLPLPQ
jgi:Auxiliary Activity family 9 (formerly GH61)